MDSYSSPASHKQAFNIFVQSTAIFTHSGSKAKGHAAGTCVNFMSQPQSHLPSRNQRLTYLICWSTVM